MAIRMIVPLGFIYILSACSMLGLEMNLKDGTWSDCVYTQKDGITFAGPLQLGGAPIEFTKPNGIKVKCVGIPKEAE